MIIIIKQFLHNTDIILLSIITLRVVLYNKLGEKKKIILMLQMLAYDKISLSTQTKIPIK